MKTAKILATLDSHEQAAQKDPWGPHNQTKCRTAASDYHDCILQSFCKDIQDVDVGQSA